LLTSVRAFRADARAEARAEIEMLEVEAQVHRKALAAREMIVGPLVDRHVVVAAVVLEGSGHAGLRLLFLFAAKIGFLRHGVVLQRLRAACKHDSARGNDVGAIGQRERKARHLVDATPAAATTFARVLVQAPLFLPELSRHIPDRYEHLVPAAQLSMSFVPVGRKNLGIQITTSGKHDS